MEDWIEFVSGIRYGGVKRGVKEDWKVFLVCNREEWGYGLFGWDEYGRNRFIMEIMSLVCYIKMKIFIINLNVDVE